MTRILFVCTGNTCRSPMAEAILKAKSIPGVEVKSAGVFASEGSPASINTLAVLEENQIYHQHQSSMLSKEKVDWATFVITMTASHKSSVLHMIPESSGKAFTLAEFIGGSSNEDIIDPFGGSVEIYRDTYAELSKKITKMIERLQQKLS